MIMNTLNAEKPSVLKAWLKYYDRDDILEDVPKCTLFDYLLQNNEAYPNDVALSYFENDITFGELFDRIRRTAGAYRAIGVRAGDVVTICSVTTPEIVYTFYALDLIGAVSNMVDPRTSSEGMREYIEESESKYLCVLNKAYPKIRDAVSGTDVAAVIVVSPADSLSFAQRAVYRLANRDGNCYSPICVRWDRFIEKGLDTPPEPAPYSSEHCAAIIHTGGTTGSPKGVMLNDDAFNAVAFQCGKNSVRLLRRQKFLNVMPPFIAYGFTCGVHMPLSLGVTSILIPNLDPKKLGALILKYKPAHMCGVPVHFQLLANDPRMKSADISFLQNSGSGGDAIAVGAEEEVNRFLKSHGSRYPLAKGYGMTELCSAACNCSGELNKPGSVGIPLLKNVISAFEPGTDRELSVGERGEICITGPTIMLGYLKKPKETANVLKTHSDGKVWVHTGDIGYVDEDGFVFIDSRIKRMIVRPDGFKVFPNVIENVVSMHAAVETCSVVAKRDLDQPQGDLPFVHITLKKSVRVSQKQIRNELVDLCGEKLPEYAQPVGFKFRESLYYTPIGKVDYRRLEMESV